MATDNSVEDDLQAYAAWFHDLDAWTEYWDIYHPETKGRFYFGDGEAELGLLTSLLPHRRKPAAFIAWTREALLLDSPGVFARAVRVPEVASAVMEVEDLVGRLFAKHFGDASDERVRGRYLDAIFQFAVDSLPPAVERDTRILAGDFRKRTAIRHTLDGDVMWFGWALQIEAADILAGTDAGHARRTLLLAGVAMGCAANFAWRGHRRTRSEYHPTAETANLLRHRGMRWATDVDSAAREVHALYRIREWGHED